MTELEKPKGFEKWRVRNAQKARRQKKRKEEQWNAQRALERKLRGRERGHTGLPQLITHKTAERWAAQNRTPKNRVVVSR